jgi:hypothetical protein
MSQLHQASISMEGYRKMNLNNTQSLRLLSKLHQISQNCFNHQLWYYKEDRRVHLTLYFRYQARGMSWGLSNSLLIQYLQGEHSTRQTLLQIDSMKEWRLSRSVDPIHRFQTSYQTLRNCLISQLCFRSSYNSSQVSPRQRELPIWINPLKRPPGSQPFKPRSQSPIYISWWSQVEGS